MVVRTKNVLVKGIAIIGCALLSYDLDIFADEGPVGQWDLQAQFGGRTNESTLSITGAGDGLKANMKSRMGKRELDNVIFADGMLEFDMTFERQGQQLTLHFAGKIEGDKLTGSWSSNSREFPVSGKRAGATKTVVGTWKLMVDSPLGNNERDLVIKPDMTGSYGGGDFPAFPIENCKVDGDSVTMDVTLKSDRGELPCTITFKIDGDKITGALDYGEGEATINGNRAKNPIVGTWKLMVDSQIGENERQLIIKPDLTGTYGGGDFPQFPVSNLKVEGDKATMDVTLDLQGQEIPATITLKLAGDKVTGKLDYGQGEASIEGKRE